MKPLVAAILFALSTVPLASGQRFLGEVKPKPPAILRAYTPLPEKPKLVEVIPKDKINPKAKFEQPKQASVNGQRTVKLITLPSLSLADALLLALPYANPETRFIYLGDVPPEKLGVMYALLNGHINHLSTEAELSRILVVPNSRGRLVAISVDNFGSAFRDSWDRLGEQEPFFHVHVNVAEVKVQVGWETVPWPGGIWEDDGKFYARGSFRWTREVFKTVKVENKVALAPWLAKSDAHKASIAKLLAATGSQTPIVSGSWFLFQTMIQKNRSPGYFDFLGLKTVKDVDDLCGFDQKVITRAKRKELLERVAISGVSFEPRGVGAFDTISGTKKWMTFDSFLAIGKKNSLNILDNALEFDANESFFALPNGLWGVFLNNAKGERQDFVPNNVGVGPDTTSTSNDGAIHPIKSCVACHYPEDGLRKLDKWARKLFKGRFSLRAATPEIERDLRAKYLRDIDGPMEDDRRKFARNLKEITGLTPKEYADAVTEFWAEYEKPVTAARAAREIGVTEKEFLAALQAYAEKTPVILPVIAALMEGERVPLAQYHEIFPNLMEVIARYK